MQGVMQDCSVERLHCPVRRHSANTSDHHCIRSLSLSGRHTRRASHDLLDHSEHSSTSSTIGRCPRTREHLDWGVPTTIHYQQDQLKTLVQGCNDLFNNSEPMPVSSADERPACTHEEVGWGANKSATLPKDQLAALLQAPDELLHHLKLRSADDSHWATGTYWTEQWLSKFSWLWTTYLVLKLQWTTYILMFSCRLTRKKRNVKKC